MPAHTLHFDLPDAERPSVWPWLIALISGACLLVVVVQKVQSIPASLLQQAEQQVIETDFSHVGVEVHGRDLELTGSIDIRQSIASLSEQLGNIEGVRIVRDSLTRHDSAEVEEQETQRFLQTLARLDVSVVDFQPGSSAFTPGSDTVLDQLAQLLVENPSKRIRIEGHTDNTGPASVNLRISEQRAQAVGRYLESQNVSFDQLITKGYGSSQPIADNDSESGRARNRRIEVSYVD